MTLRLDNACGVDQCPQPTADENQIIGFGSGLTRPRKWCQGRSLPRARSNRNGGRDQIGILGDLKSECLGEIIGIRLNHFSRQSRTGWDGLVHCAHHHRSPQIWAENQARVRYLTSHGHPRLCRIDCSRHFLDHHRFESGSSAIFHVLSGSKDVMFLTRASVS
jgi:hypothetical protein